MSRMFSSPQFPGLLPGQSQFLDPVLAQQIQQVLELTAERLAQPDSIQQAARLNGERTIWKSWQPTALSGWCSQALLFTAFAQAFPEQKHYHDLANHYIRLAAQATQAYPLTAYGVHDGCAGMAFTLLALLKLDARYQAACQKVTTSLCEYVLSQTWTASEHGIATETYDAISGAAGILVYLISLPFDDARISEARERLLHFLISLCGSDVESLQRNCFTAVQQLPTDELRTSYPEGQINCGLAHGVPGILAALALAWQEGYRLPGQREALQAGCQWLLQQRVQDAWGSNWPAAAFPDGTPAPATRGAWCYGAPGVARTLWLAGQALENHQLSELAMDALLAVLKRPGRQQQLMSPSFCHGWAGILSIALVFAEESQDPRIIQQIPSLVKTILDTFSAEHRFCFQDLEAEDEAFDDSSLLTGSTGIALTLLLTLQRAEAHWLRLFLLA